MQSDVSHLVLRLMLPLFLASAALAQKVIIEYDHTVDFSRYRKYDWKEHPFLKNHPESERFTVGADLVWNNVNDILMKRGYAPVDESQPEFFTQFITARLGQGTHSIPAAGAYPNAYIWPGSWYSWNSAWFTAWGYLCRELYGRYSAPRCCRPAGWSTSRSWPTISGSRLNRTFSTRRVS